MYSKKVRLHVNHIKLRELIGELVVVHTMSAEQADGELNRLRLQTRFVGHETLASRSRSAHVCRDHASRILHASEQCCVGIAGFSGNRCQ